MSELDYSICCKCNKNRACMEGFWFLCQNCVEMQYFKKITGKKCQKCNTIGSIDTVPRRYKWIPYVYAIGYSVDRFGNLRINRDCMKCYNGNPIDPRTSKYLLREIQELHNKIDFLNFDRENLQAQIYKITNSKSD